MNLFAVFKEGCLSKECAGIFSTLDLAMAAAEQCINGEFDDYHCYGVVPFVLDKITRQTPVDDSTPDWYSGGILEEPASICTWTRTKRAVSYRLNQAPTTEGKK